MHQPSTGTHLASLNIYAYAWIGNVHSNYIEMHETILVIQCHNNLRKIEYRTVVEKWSPFVVVAIFEIYLVCFLKLWILVVTLNNIVVAVRFVVTSNFVFCDRHVIEICSCKANSYTSRFQDSNRLYNILNTNLLCCFAY